MKRKILMAAAAALGLMVAITTTAQENTGTILGVVKDSAGAVIPGAGITILDEETNLTRTVKTGSDGAFRAPALSAGHYTVKVEATGFRPQEQAGLILEVAEELVANFTLTVGSATEQVEVTAAIPLVNTTDSALGTVINEHSMVELPLNGRDYVTLTMIQPGVSQQRVTSTGNDGATGGGTWFSANGAPVRSNYFTLDGAPLMNAEGASSASQSGDTLGIDGILEYKVVSSAFSAAYGMAMGSQMVMASKSGTNQWHGDLFEYLRNSAMDARNYFDHPLNGRRLPEFQRNNFGGSFGGPIKRDRTFFYAVYEGLSENLGITVLDNVPPAACHQLVNPGTNNTTLANPAACAPGLTSSSFVPQSIQPLLALYPAPDLSNNEYTFPTSTTDRDNYGQIRVDQTFSTADTMFVRYTIDNDDLNSALNSFRAGASGTGFPGLRALGSSRLQALTLSETHIFSPALLNTPRLSFTRTAPFLAGAVSGAFSSPSVSLVSGEPFSGFSVGGITGPPGALIPQYQINNVLTFSDDVYYERNRHSLRFGTLYNHILDEVETQARQVSGTVTFSQASTFMTGIYQSYADGTPAGEQIRDFSFNTLGFYAQDDFRVIPRLTLNLGLRYEFQTVPQERHGIQSRFLNFADPTQTWTYGPIMDNPSLKNFEPRVGFAWNVLGNGKTAIRSAFGVYDEIANVGTALNILPSGTPPYSSSNTISSNPQNLVFSTPLQFPATTGLCAATLPPASCTERLMTLIYGVKQPYSLQWNFTVEQQMPLGMALEVSYVGLRGIHLWQVAEANPIPPTTYINGAPAWQAYLCDGVTSATTCPSSETQLPNPAYSRINYNYASNIAIDTLGDSWFDSLQVNLTKQLSHGLNIESNYSFGKSLDTTEGPLFSGECADVGGFEGTSPLNLKLDKGPSCFDVRHQWHLNLLYHIPNINSNLLAAKFLHGWWVGSIVTGQTGFPFTPLLNTERSNNGNYAGFGSSGIVDRPNVGTTTTSPTINGNTYQFIPYNKKTVITGNPNEWFNPLMFTLGPTGMQGDASRGMLTGPGLFEWDNSFNKDTRLPFLGENAVLEFRAEIFNILNRANFSLPANIGRTFTGTLTDPAGASEAPISGVGQITSTAAPSRQIQLALKVIF